MELRQKHGDTFTSYAAAVPLFFPRLFAAQQPADGPAFSWTQYKKNHEYQASLGFALLLAGLVLLWWLRLR